MDDLTLSDLRNVVDTLSDEGYDWESGEFIKDFPENTDDEVIELEWGFSEDGGPDWPLRDSPKKPDSGSEAAPSTLQTEHP